MRVVSGFVRLSEKQTPRQNKKTFHHNKIVVNTSKYINFVFGRNQ